MKNLLIILALFLGLNLVAVAQDAKKPVKKEQGTTKAVPATKKALPAKTAEVKKDQPKKAEAEKPKKAEAKPDAAKQKAATDKGVVLKKDGTPDKRYKNSDAKTGPLKKDGTPDLRYKENKKK